VLANLAMIHFRLIVFSAVCLLTIVGCGGQSGPTRIALSGSITVNGIKLERGAISLRPVGGHSAPAAVTTVESGSYQFTSENGPLPGPYAVKINVDPESEYGKTLLRGPTTATGGPPALLGPKGGSLAPSLRTHTPAQPKLHWELHYTVPPDGSPTKNFELTS
jgi:hypothetical protein